MELRFIFDSSEHIPMKQLPKLRVAGSNPVVR
jgi:hypothetical protein